MFFFGINNSKKLQKKFGNFVCSCFFFVLLVMFLHFFPITYFIMTVEYAQSSFFRSAPHDEKNDTNLKKYFCIF